MGDFFLKECFVGGDKALVNRQACKRDAVYEGMALESLNVCVVFAFHLAMKNVDAFDANAGGFIYYRADRKLLFRKVPI